MSGNEIHMSHFMKSIRKSKFLINYFSLISLKLLTAIFPQKCSSIIPSFSDLYYFSFILFYFLTYIFWCILVSSFYLPCLSTSYNFHLFFPFYWMLCNFLIFIFKVINFLPVSNLLFNRPICFLTLKIIFWISVHLFFNFRIFVVQRI